ncbi:hypothetical protein [Pantoea agglomerans]|uniref:hypothetical protein n=1 Tax=Enterobacter agglomerans TaxID=549 RepID=UPI003C7BB779
MTCMVVFGAGASYGSGDVIPYPPPLGDKLFEKLEDLNKVASKIPKHIKDTFKLNFEKGMAEYFRYTDMSVLPFQRELAGYLAKFSPGETNHYARLISKLNPRRTIYCSLNYDLLFELAANSINFNIIYSNKFELGHVRLLKIHGSSNFWPNLADNAFRGVRITGATIADMNLPIKPVNQQKSIFKAFNEDSIAPAIAMYAEGKAVRVSPDYVSHQQDMWENSLKSSSKVFIVGVRVHLADKHIWEKLASCKAEIHYFGMDKDEPEFNEWKKTYNVKKGFFYKLNFEEAVDTINNLAN